MAKALAIIVVISAVGYWMLGKSYPDLKVSSPEQNAAMVVVENTPMVEGRLPAPQYFPADIPVEKTEIIESATARYPDKNYRQLFLSYLSRKSAAEKYSEYLDYMDMADYRIEEKTLDAVKIILGKSDGANLTVSIGSRGNSTLVELSYLLKN